MNKVKLISMSIPVLDINGKTPTPEELIVYCARVSSPQNQDNLDSAPKLLKYCIKNNHWSIFEMVNFCCEITTSRAISAQILRHKSFSFQEFCIAGDSLITTIFPSNGLPNYIPIKKLYERQNWKNYKNIMLRVYDEKNLSFTASRLKEVFYTGKKECFKVYLEDGKTIICSKEHKFLTRNGAFETLENITNMKIIGNSVVLSKPQQIGVNGIICYQNYDWLKNAKYECINNKTGLFGIADMAGVSTHTIRKWLKKHSLSFSKKEVAMYNEPWNKNKTGYGVKARTEEQKQHMRDITPNGKDHHAYKGGAAAQRRAIANYFVPYRKSIFNKYNYICQMCFMPFNTFDGKIDLHHIKEVGLYPELALDVNNIIPVHRKCHMEYHGKTYYFKEIRKNHRGNTLVPRFVDINKIEYVGIIDTYDLEVEHISHNYVANKIVVHNSQRYAEVHSTEVYQARRQDTKNRQNSIDDFDDETKKWFIDAQNKMNDFSSELYNQSLKKGIAKETARFLLPMSSTTRLYMNGSLRSWITYLLVRAEKGTQLEHREIAVEIMEVLKQYFPNIYVALKELHGDIFV